LAPPRQLLLVSGSNMSGKSTYLRSAGVAAVLAWAGGPVRASQMRISRFQVAAILHAEDSLRLGMSRFAAELARMRRLIELSKGEIPLLFLLDEIFSGTNSSDRLAGAEALIRRLVQTSAVGMVTTHDLTLAKIADDLGDKGANVHFVDNWSGGMMSFDYRLQPGVVPRSNALGLMRAIGLDL
jgi:DNA mismatch repair ATPase MutS